VRLFHATFALVLAALVGSCDGGASQETGEEAFERGMRALEDGDSGRAEQVFEAMLLDDPADPVARAGLARALARQDRYAEAIVQDKLAYAADPRLAEVAYNIACSYAALGEPEEALRWLARAWDGGIRDLNLIEQDPDLLPLRSDHRFAFFLATGALSLAEQEAYVRVSPAMVSPGGEVRVELVVVSLNRPLMATPERLVLGYAGELPAGALEPSARIELFEAGEIGGREYFRRFITYRFVAREAVETLLGPFELTLGDQDIPVRPAWLSVQDALPELFPRDRAPSWERETRPGAAEWFAAPGTATEGARHPFARWDRGPDGSLDLLVGVELYGDGIAVPDDLVLDPLPPECGPWLYPRQTAFLRTRAEGLSRVWFHRRWGGETPADGCASPLPLRVTLGGEAIYEASIPWP